VYKRCVVSFGNSSSALGKTESPSFKDPSISKPAEDEFKNSFQPTSFVKASEWTGVVTESGDLFETGNLAVGSKDAFTKVPCKEKVKLVDAAGYSAWFVSQSNKVFYKGTSAKYHMPNNEMASNFKELTGWNEEEEQVITHLSVGDGFTVILTENGKLWAMG
jgi:hypothetical protein